MVYKTLTLKIYRPSAHKRALLDTALANYTAALQFLLDACRADVLRLAGDGDLPVPRTTLLALLTPALLRRLNAFDAEPFKDSLKIEFTIVAGTFLAQRNRNPKTPYPSVTMTDEAYAASSASLIRRFDEGGLGKKQLRRELDKLIARCGKLHPVYFGRYSDKRDYCLLYDETTGRYYAKLYLLNAKNRVASGEPSGPGRLQLRYVTEAGGEPHPPAGGSRFIIVPLAFGRHQLSDLERALENPRLLHTARLKKQSGDYYLLINLACAGARRQNTAALLGVARAADGGLHYTAAPDSESRFPAAAGGTELLASGSLAREADGENGLYLFAKRILALCRQYRAQLLLETSGGKNDKVLCTQPGVGASSQAAAPLKTTEYARLARILRFKMQENGFPEPVELSANGLYTTCPACGRATGKSRISPTLFICVECGFAANAASIGSANLIRKFDRYRNGRVPVCVCRCEDGLLFYNRILGFECLLPPDSSDRSQVYYELSLMANNPEKYESNRKKYAMLKRLRETPDIAGAVRFVDTRRA